MNQSRTEPGQSMEEILASIRRIIAEGEREAQEAGGQGEGSETAAAARSEPATGSNAAEAGQTEVLVLTEMVQDDGSVVSLPPAPAGEEPQDVGPDESPPAAFPGEGTSSIAAAVAIETVRAESAAEIFAHISAAVASDLPTATGPAPSVDRAAPPESPEPERPSTPTPSTDKTDKERIPVSAEGSKKPDLVSEEALAASTAALSQLAHSVSRTREPTPGQSKTVEELVREAVEPMLKQWLDTNLPRIVERMVREAIDRVVRRVE
ncbi:MAG: DUF2497 domain-containing protein [Dongiaceae bacterium]